MFKRLQRAHKQLLHAMVAGAALKVHRDLNGGKVYRLHPLGAGVAQTIAEADVIQLEKLGLIESNMKFPAATFLLTEKGLAAADTRAAPVGPRGIARA